MNSLQLEGSLAGWQQYKCDTLGAAAAAPGWCNRLVQQQQPQPNPARAGASASAASCRNSSAGPGLALAAGQGPPSKRHHRGPGRAGIGKP